MDSGPIAKRALGRRLEATRLDFLDFFDTTVSLAAWWHPLNGSLAERSRHQGLGRRPKREGEVWRGRGAETYGKCNFLAGPLWEGLLKQYSSTTYAVLHHLPQHLTFDDVTKVPETLAEP